MNLKKMTGRLAALIAVLAAPALFAQTAATKIAVFDMDKLLDKSALGKRISGEMETFQKAKQAEIQAKEKELEDLENRLKTQRGILDAAKYEALVVQFNEKKNAYEAFAKTAVSDLERRKAKAQQEFLGKVRDVVTKFGAQGGYVMILERGAAVYVAPGIDVTDQIAVLMDKTP